MEEKLYFKPVKYGKGIKKRKEKIEKDNKDGNDHRVHTLVLFLLLIAVVVIVILWLLHGKTSTTGQYPANVRTESLECVSDDVNYSKIGSTKYHVVSKELKLSLLFVGEESLKAISLKDSLTFNTEVEAKNAEAVVHATFNTSLVATGYNSEEFDNKFSIIDNKLVVTVHSGSHIDERSKGYFLIESNENPNTLQEFRNIYETKGFTCKTSAE